MALKCHLSLPIHTISAIMHMYGAADGEYVICQCVSIAVSSLIPHVKPPHAPL